MRLDKAEKQELLETIELSDKKLEVIRKPNAIGNLVNILNCKSMAELVTLTKDKKI